MVNSFNVVNRMAGVSKRRKLHDYCTAKIPFCTALKGVTIVKNLAIRERENPSGLAMLGHLPYGRGGLAGLLLWLPFVGELSPQRLRGSPRNHPSLSAWK